MLFPLSSKEAIDEWNNAFVNRDSSQLLNFLTDDFLCQSNSYNHILEQVLDYSTNCISIFGHYKITHENKYSLCGFYSYEDPENPTKPTKVVYRILCDVNMTFITVTELRHIEGVSNMFLNLT